MLDANRKFGGIGLLFIGDFFQQLPPPIGTSLYKEELNMRSSVGDMMRTFTVLQFTSQMRARMDSSHTELLQQFRDLSTSDHPFTASTLTRPTTCVDI